MLSRRLIIIALSTIGLVGLFYAKLSTAEVSVPKLELTQAVFGQATGLESKYSEFRGIYTKSQRSPFYAQTSPIEDDIWNLCWDQPWQGGEDSGEATEENPEYQSSLENCQSWLLSLNPYLARELYRDYLKETDWFKGKSYVDKDLIYGKVGILLYCKVISDQDSKLKTDSTHQDCLKSISDYSGSDQDLCNDLSQIGYVWNDDACSYSSSKSADQNLDNLTSQLGLNQNPSADAGGGVPEGKVLGNTNNKGECEVDNPILQFCPPVQLNSAAPTGESVSGLGTKPRPGIPDPPKNSEITNKPGDLGERERPLISIKKYVGHSIDDLSDAQDTTEAVKFYPGQSIVYQVVI
nr:hypothetical protein [Candidatus Saccharibacteria bacterium]